MKRLILLLLFPLCAMAQSNPQNAGGLGWLNACGVMGLGTNFFYFDTSGLFNTSAGLGVMNGQSLTNLTYQWTTNPVTTGNGTATWDVSKPRQTLATNANITISLANVPTTLDKMSTLILTNSGASASTITATLSGFWVMSNGVPVTSIIVTNNDSKYQRVAFSVDCYASQYTNAAYYNIYSP